MGASFHQADRQTYRRVAIVGALFCFAFVAISFSLRPQAEERPALVKADSAGPHRRRSPSRQLNRDQKRLLPAASGAIVVAGVGEDGVPLR